MDKLYQQIENNRQAVKTLTNGNLNNGNQESEKAIDYPKLSDAALHGLAGKIVRLIEPHTEADSAALLIQFLAGFGNLINKTAYFRAGADHHYTKIFAVLVGATASGRKGSSWSEIKRVLIRADESFASCIQNGLSSGEGLIYYVRDAQFKKTPIREKQRIVDYQDEMIDQGATEKRAFIVEPEFARVLKVSQREGNTLSSVIREAWDTDRLRVMTKNAIQASNAHISIVGHITKDELHRTMAETETTNGFANRFLWVCVRRSKYLPDGGNLTDYDLNPIVEDIAECIRFAKQTGEITRDDEANKLWREIYQSLSDGHSGLLGSVTSRATAQTLRLACLYALLDCSSRIRWVHLNAALSLWKYCEDSAKYIFGEALGNKLADDIYAALQKSPEGMSRNDLMDYFKRHKSSTEIKNALELLLEVGKVQSVTEKTSGRSKEIFKVLGCEKSEKSEKTTFFDQKSGLNSHISHISHTKGENFNDAEREEFEI